MGGLGLIPGLGRSPGEGKGYALQYSGLENPMDCRVHGVAKVGHDWVILTFTSLYSSPPRNQMVKGTHWWNLYWPTFLRMEPRTREWRINLGRKSEDSSIAVKLPSSQKRKTKGSWLWSTPCLSACPFSCVLCPSHGQHVVTRVPVYHCP